MQLARDARIGGEEGQRFLDGHIEHVGDGFALVEYLERLAVVALALADLAGHVDIRQKVHLDAQNTVAGAGLAAAAAHVEGETVFLIAARLGLRRGGEDLADHIEQAGVGGRVAARGAADGALVDGDHLVKLLHALDAVACAGARVRAVEVALEGLVDDLVDERGFAAAGYAGDDRHHAQRNPHVDVFQVVGARAAHRQPAGGCFTVQRHGDAAPAGEIRAGDGIRAGHDLLRRALRDEAAAVLARAGADIHDLIRREHGVLVVLDDDQRVADVAQVLERFDEPRVVALVQADGGLVQNIQHADEARTDLRRQPDALCLAAGERARRAGKRQIPKPHVDQKAQARDDLLEDRGGDHAVLFAEGQRGKERLRVEHGQVGGLRDGFSADRHGQNFRAEALAAAIRAGRLAHQAVVIGLGGIALRLGGAPLGRGNHALKRRAEGVRIAVGARVMDVQRLALAAVENHIQRLFGQPVERRIHGETVFFAQRLKEHARLRARLQTAPAHDVERVFV